MKCDFIALGGVTNPSNKRTDSEHDVTLQEHEETISGRKSEKKLWEIVVKLGNISSYTFDMCHKIRKGFKIETKGSFTFPQIGARRKLVATARVTMS